MTPFSAITMTLTTLAARHAVLAEPAPALASIFVHPVSLEPWMRVALVLPLTLAVSIVYKALRTENLRDLPAASLALWVTIVIAMYLVGIGLWVLYHFLRGDLLPA